ncbi:MAG: IS5 family transposase [Nitrospirota bacterium]
MKPSHRRHAIANSTWELLEPHWPGREGVWGGIATDTRLFIEAVFWMLRTGAPWRDVPPDLGDWKHVPRRFCRWRDKGLWEKLLETLMDEPDYEGLMIDASHCNVHPHAAGAKGGNQERSPDKRGLNTQIPLAVAAHGLPLRVVVTQGTVADCTQPGRLMEGIAAVPLIADTGDDSDAIVDQATSRGLHAGIPPRKNRLPPRPYAQERYKLRHRVENAFLHLKRWRGIATRYAKHTASFLAAVQIRCIALRAAIS